MKIHTEPYTFQTCGRLVVARKPNKDGVARTMIGGLLIGDNVCYPGGVENTVTDCYNLEEVMEQAENRLKELQSL